MSTFTTELFTVSAPEGHKAQKNDALLSELTQLAKQGGPGIQKQAWGDCLEKGGIAIGDGTTKPVKQWILEWDSSESVIDPTTLKTIQDKLAQVVTDTPAERTRISFRTSPSKCISAPITEVIYATAKPDADLTKFAEICDVSLDACTDESKECHGTAWGYTTTGKSGRDIVMLIGWESVEAHRAFIQTEICKVTTGPFTDNVAAAGMNYAVFNYQ